MLLGIADICLLDHIRAGLSQEDFIRKAAELGAQTASIRFPEAGEGQHLPALAEELGIELEFRTGPANARELAECIRRAHSFGASFLRTMVSGKYHYKDAAKQAQTLAAAEQRLKAVTSLLSEVDMQLGIENHADVTSPELIALIDAVGSQRVGVLLDLGNSIEVFENPRYTIEMLAPYTIALHVKDLSIGQRHGVDFCHLPVPLGEGIIDFDHAMEQITTHCPNARFVIEGVHPPLENPAESLEDEAEMLEKSVAFAQRLLVQYSA